MKKPTALERQTADTDNKPITNGIHLLQSDNKRITNPDAGGAVQDEHAHLFADIEVPKKNKDGTTTTEYIPFPKALQRMKLDFIQQPHDSRQTHWQLTNAEYGLFIALRDLAAEYVVITSDHEALAKRTYTALDEFEASWPQIANLFVVEGGTMFCPEVIPWLRTMRAKSRKYQIAANSRWQKEGEPP